VISTVPGGFDDRLKNVFVGLISQYTNSTVFSMNGETNNIERECVNHKSTYCG